MKMEHAELGVLALVGATVCLVGGFALGMHFSLPPTCMTCANRCTPFAIATCEFVPEPRASSGERVVCTCKQAELK